MSGPTRRRHSNFRRMLLVAVLTVLAGPAAAFDYQLHGFAAQGYSLSDGDNYFGDSRHGSANFYELGLNGTLALRPDLLVSAQGLMRRAGRTDTEGLRLDFAQIDYRFLSTADSNAGLRLGRVRKPYGLFNDTRDVVFTRPGITLPDAVYLEALGLRSLLFSGDGAQLYAAHRFGQHAVSLSANYDLEHALNQKQKLQLLGIHDLPNEVHLGNFYTAQLLDEWNGGRLKFATTYLHAAFTLRPSPDSPLEGRQDFAVWVASAQYNAEHLSLTGEYFIDYTKGVSNYARPTSASSDGFYVQAAYRVAPRWTLLTRYSASFANRHDRDGREYEARTGKDRYRRFGHDETIGLKWLPTEHWGLWTELHLIQGSNGAPDLDNEGRDLARHTLLLQFMAAYRF
jgi:hypothetical protein